MYAHTFFRLDLPIPPGMSLQLASVSYEVPLVSLAAEGRGWLSA